MVIKYDGGESYDYAPFSNDFIFLGNAPPRKNLLYNQESIGIPTEALDPTILAQSRVNSYTKINFVEWFGGAIGNPVDLYVSFQTKVGVKKSRQA